ncbi:alpha/beta fold hydrolase [Pseudonocardia sp.]|uniref:alpha/beta fold hydrolase n=1 Tax=Pseudonocardia sp. TaxID=60912 RepID=UPI003D13D1A6
MWDELAADLERDHLVVRYDARSHGRSSTAHRDHHPAEDLVAVMDALGIERATLVGSSMGAVTSADVAWRHPERVAALVLLGGDVSEPRAHEDPFVARWYAVQEAAIAARDAQGWVEALLRYGVDGPRREPADVDPAVRERCRAMATATVAAHHTATGRQLWYDVRERAAEITPPTLVVVGELEIGWLHTVAGQLEAALPDVRRVEEPGVGHMMMLEAPARTAELVRAQLGRVQDATIAAQVLGPPAT